MMRIAVINDLSSIGHSSLMVNIPLISSYGHQVIPIVSTTLSKHSGFKDSVRVDINDSFNTIVDAFIIYHDSFDWLLVGYLANSQQVEKIIQLIQANPTMKVVIDPVFADNGHIYSGMSHELIEGLKSLLPYATYIVPNISEAAYLSRHDFQVSYSQQDILAIIDDLRKLTDANIIITGIDNGNYIDTIYFNNDQFNTFSQPKLNLSVPGCGDVFDSILVSNLMYNIPIDKAISHSASFVSHCIQELIDTKANPMYGLNIEKTIKQA